MRQTYPESIRANVAEEAIAKVSRFFDASAGQIIGELLQNARRSGADEVRIVTGNGRITIADNGRGIGDPTAVLAFGRSGWNADTAAAEDPAGMGIFSLARHHASIASRPAAGTNGEIAPGWAVELAPEHFLGTEPARVIASELPPRPHGTQTSFRIDKSARELAWAVEEAAEHYPVPVMLNGKPVTRKSILEGCIASTEWNGVRIGVRKAHDSHWNRGLINFHGHKVFCENLPRVTATRTGGEPPMSWWTVVDVVDGKGLELVLPARRQVVHNKYLGDLIEQAWKTLFDTLRNEGAENLPYEAWAEAGRHGIALAGAEPRLPVWKPATAEEWETPDERFYDARRVEVSSVDEPMLMDAKLECPDAQVLGRALAAAGMSERVFAPQRQYRGYGWYDGMARITAVQIELKGPAGAENVMDLRAEHRGPRSTEPVAIDVIMTIDRPKETTSRVRIPSAAALIADSVTCVEEIEVALARGHDMDPDALTELFFDAYFCPSEDAGADSPSTQAGTFDRNCRELATGLTSSWEQARAGRLENLAKTYLAREVQKDETLRFTIRSDRSVEVEIERSAA